MDNGHVMGKNENTKVRKRKRGKTTTKRETTTKKTRKCEITKTKTRNYDDLNAKCYRISVIALSRFVIVSSRFRLRVRNRDFAFSAFRFLNSFIYTIALTVFCLFYRKTDVLTFQTVC